VFFLFHRANWVNNSSSSSSSFAFSVTSGSDQMRQVGSTFLQLKLVLDKGDKIENVHMGKMTFSFSSLLNQLLTDISSTLDLAETQS